MFGKRFELFQVLGFKIRIDASWFLLAILITWSLASSYFPAVVPDLPTTSYWWMGGFGALGLFVSVVLHELAHSLVARRFGIEMDGITLFIFGGVAEMRNEPPSPRAEALVAIAGPIASVALSGAFRGLDRVGQAGGVFGPEVGAALDYLVWVNLIPAFPLDGGRVLRAALWHFKGSLRWASHVSSRVGSGFGTVLILLGLASALFGNLVAGIWWFVLGLFLRGAARASYQQVLLRQALEGEPVSRFMSGRPITVPPSIPVRELVEDYVYKHHHQIFPVVTEGRLVGCATTHAIKELPRDQWESQSVQSIMVPCTGENTVSPETDAMEALSRMNRQRISRLLVVRDGELVGILTLKDLLSFFASKFALGDFDDDSAPPSFGSRTPPGSPR
jgi:Zn-dependent protease/CBS domain-containing protein